MTQINVLLADDYPLLRLGLRSAIERAEDMSVCGTADHVEATLDAMVSLKPDVAVVSFALRSTALVALIRNARLRHRGLSVLVAPVQEDPGLARRLLLAGARGFIRRADSPTRLIDSIRRATQSIRLVETAADPAGLAPDAFGSVPRQSGQPDHCLTVREQEILELIGTGSAPREIAQTLGLSIKTVESHRENIKQKLGIKTASKLALFAFQWQQLPPRG